MGPSELREDLPKAATAPVVEKSFRKLFESIGRLNDNVSRLKHRLHSVLSPVTNGVDPEPTSPGTPPVRISENVEISAVAVNRINKEVNSLLESLEI